jgi:uncharacterized protein
MPDESNADRVRRFFDLMHAKDIDAWASLWADDARIVVPYPLDGFPTSIEGKDEIVTSFQRLFGNFERFDYTIRALYRTDDPDVVVVEWSVSAMIASTGEPYESDPITVFVFDDGKIARYHDYFDPRRFARVVEALPSV